MKVRLRLKADVGIEERFLTSRPPFGMTYFFSNSGWGIGHDQWGTQEPTCNCGMWGTQTRGEQAEARLHRRAWASFVLQFVTLASQRAAILREKHSVLGPALVRASAGPDRWACERIRSRACLRFATIAAKSGRLRCQSCFARYHPGCSGNWGD